jgi:hypothetical protein
LGAEPEVRADVFVFAVQICKDPEAYNVLDVAQWEFYVVGASHVREAGFKSVTISRVRRYAEPVSFGNLASAIETVGRPVSNDT